MNIFFYVLVYFLLVIFVSVLPVFVVVAQQCSFLLCLAIVYAALCTEEGVLGLASSVRTVGLGKQLVQ